MATFDDMELERKLTVYDKGFDPAPAPTASTSPARATSGARASPNAEPLRLECEHFVQCVREGAPPRSDGQSGLRVVRVLEGLQRSLDASARGSSGDGRLSVAPDAVVDDARRRSRPTCGSGRRAVVGQAPRLLGPTPAPGARPRSRCRLDAGATIGPGAIVLAGRTSARARRVAAGAFVRERARIGSASTVGPAPRWTTTWWWAIA